MSEVKKLSTLLNRYYSYYKVKDLNLEDIQEIINEYIKDSEDKIYKKPANALRAIKVEMLDIHNHYDRYVKELEACVTELHAIISKGPKLEEIDRKKVEILEEKRNVLAEVECSLADSFAYLTRMLLEHFSESEIGVEFLDKFIKYLGPFDWMGKRANSFIFHKKTENNTSTLINYPFDEEIKNKANLLIAEDELLLAIDLLLSKTESKVVKDELINLKARLSKHKKDCRNGILLPEVQEVGYNKIRVDLLGLIQ